MDKAPTSLKTFVIIVTFNGMRYIDRCLKSVLASSIPLQIIIIDNHSTDQTIAKIENNYLTPKLILIKQVQNLGFGKANNLGLKYALTQNADYVFLLNQDAYLEPDTIKNLIYASQHNPKFGVLSPIQISVAHDYKQQSSLHSQARQISPVKFMPAAMWLLPTAVIKKIGCFDPSFFHYGEDNDYLNRVRFHGFKIGICHSAVGYHANQGRNFSPQQELYLDYIEYKQTVKNLNLNLFVTIIHAGLKSCHRSFLYFIALRFKMMFLTLSKYLLVLKNFPQIIKERKASRQVGAYLRQNFDIIFFELLIFFNSILNNTIN